MARMFLPLVVAMLAAVVVITMLSIPIARPEQLLPLFPEGIKPILHGVYFSFGFPFAEMALFAMLLPYVRKEGRKALVKWMTGTTVVNMLSLLFVIVVSVVTLGPLAAERKFSLYSVARLLEIGNFLEGTEAIVGYALIAGSYMKATLVLYMLNQITSSLLKTNGDMLLPFKALISFMLSVTMFQNESEFNESVNVVWPLITMTVGMAPLLLMAVITFCKRSIKSFKSDEFGSN